MDDADLDALAAMRAESIESRTRRAPILIVEDFLPRDLHDRVLDGLVAIEDAFWSNRTAGRDALVVVDPAPARAVVEEIERRFDEIVAVLADLGAPLDDVTDPRLEVASATATGHANFHSPHIDNDPLGGVDRVVSRRISFVWHAFREPRVFEGGGLRMWDHREIPSERGPWTPATTWVDLPCIDNSLVAFSSYSLHEVETVRMETGGFVDRRFAVVTAAHAVPAD